MKKTGRAYFVERPRVLEDLRVPHLIEQERMYEIVKTVTLSKTDYENFVTDMVADRQFIEDYAGLCEMGAIWKCIAVRQRGETEAVLVMPEDECYVGWAALQDKAD